MEENISLQSERVVYSEKNLGKLLKNTVKQQEILDNENEDVEEKVIIQKEDKPRLSGKKEKRKSINFEGACFVKGRKERKRK